MVSGMRVLRNSAVAAAMMVAAATQAQSGPIRPAGATVIVNEVPVFSFKAPYQGLPAESRAALFVQRLTSTPGSVTLSGSGEQRKLFRGSVLLGVITSNDAQADGSTLKGLATNWVTSLKAALQLPALKVPEGSMTIPVGEDRSFHVLGSRAYLATTTSSNFQVARPERTQSGWVVHAGASGQATLTVSTGSDTQILNVEVQPYAANLPQSLNATVTGLPAGDDTVKGAIENAVRTQLAMGPGASVSFKVPNIGELGMGASQMIDLPVRIEGPKMFPREGMVHVAIKNMPIARRPESELWYCNDPESLKMPGPLFSAPLLSETPIRLLYHHVNDTQYPLYVRIQAVNDSDKPARLLLMPGDSKPDKNPVLAGLMAADQFLKHWLSNSGEVVTVGPHCSMPISLRRLTPGDTMSGICSVRLLAEGPDSVLVRADAIPPFDPDKRWAAAINSATPWRYVGAAPVGFYDEQPTVASNHIYPNPFRQEEVNYQVGGRYGFVRIGQRPISSSDQARALEGNFGVVYTIKANITNPTNAPADIEVVFEASAGYAAALFMVNGELKKTQPLPPKGETQLALLHLDPGASKTLTLMTIPHSGGSYPATVTIRPIQDSSRYRASDRSRRME